MIHSNVSKLSKNKINSKDKNQFDNTESQNINGQIIDDNITGNVGNENDDNEEMEEIEEIPEEEQENDDNKNDNNEESSSLRNGREESKLKKFFLYLKEGNTWRPIPTINTTVLCLEIVGAIFFVIGIIILGLSNDIKQIEIRYDDNENCQIGKKCDINFTIPKDMKKNIFIYYRLNNFYQNHRRYIKSKSNKQLKGNILKEEDIKEDCDPIILNKDIYEGLMKIDRSGELPPDGVAHPCGLIAKSFFNDTYEIKKHGSNEEIIIKGDGIAWDVDKDKYKNSQNYSQHQWLNVENERFMVWMRPAALPDFRKPWGRIEKELSKGEYTVTITNNYPVKYFNGKKFFILSTVNSLGGKNYLLSILYLVLGGISIIAGILFWFGYKKYNLEKKSKETKID